MTRTDLFHRIVASIAEWFTAASPHVLPIAADAAIKGAIVLALVAVATLAMRRTSAAARHLAWFAGTLSLLLLPIVSLLVPGWHVLPSWTAPAAINVARPLPTEQLADTPSQQNSAANDTQIHQSEAAMPPSVSRTETSAVPPTAPVAPVMAPAPSTILFTWQAVSLLIWLAGSAILLGQIALGFLSLGWLRHRSSRISGGHLLAAVREIAAELGVRRRIELLTSSRRAMPMIWGLWRIRVLLPAEAADWSAEQSRVVLLHELAHARRFDCLTQFVAQLACALFWFNPLVWLARWRMQIDREQACDDLVLASGTKASAYAEQLVRIAAQMPTPHYSAAAIAMARPSTLESRVRAILDPTRNRRRLATTGAILLTIAVGLCAVALAALRAEVRPNPPPGFGRVVDLQGRPIVGAKLTDAAAKWSAVSGTDGLFHLPRIQHPHQFGKFNFTVEAVGFARRDDVMLLLDPSGALLEQSLLVDVSKRPTEGRGIIQLQRPGRVEGRVLGPDGKPLAAAPVELDVRNYFDGVTHYIGSAASTVTDANGRFTIDNVLPGELLLRYPGDNARKPIEGFGAGLRITLADGQTLKGVDLDLSKSTAGATGRVVDKAGSAVSGAEVAFVWDNGGGWNCNPWPDAISKTDDRGRFRLARLPPGNWHILVFVGKTTFDPVPVTLQENHVSTADVVLPVAHTSADAGQHELVSPLDASQLPPPLGFGRVIDTQNRPIAGAKLSQKQLKWSATSDASGLFSLPKPGGPRQYGQFDLSVVAPGFFSRRSVMFMFVPNGSLLNPNTPDMNAAGKLGDDGVIRLQRLGRVEGIVLGPDGKPLPKAPVELDVRNHSENVTSIIGSAAHAITNAKGRFTMNNVPPGDLLIYYPGWNGPPSVTGIATALAAKLADGQTLRNVVLDLSKSTAIAAGRVLDRNGKPVAGASVALQSASGMGWGAVGSIFQAKTDDNGSYRLEKLPQGNWAIMAQIGTASDMRAVSLSADKPVQVDLTLPVVHTKSGRVRRVQPMDQQQTPQEWIDATLAGDTDGANAVVAPGSPFDRNSGRLRPLLKQIKRFTSSSVTGENIMASATTNTLDFGGGRHGTIEFKMTHPSDSWLIDDVVDESGKSLVGD